MPPLPPAARSWRALLFVEQSGAGFVGAGLLGVGVFHLVPVSAALCVDALFGQGIGSTAQIGIGIATFGVVQLAMRAAAPRRGTQPS